MFHVSHSDFYQDRKLYSFPYKTFDGIFVQIWAQTAWLFSINFSWEEETKPQERCASTSGDTPRPEDRHSSRDSGQGALTVRATAIEGHPADAAVLVVGYPEPSGHAVPAFDLHLHGARSLRGGKRPPGCAESADLRHLETKEGVSPRGSSAGNSGRRRAIRAVCKGAGAGPGSSGRPGGPVLVLRQHRTSAPASAEGVVSFL